MSLRAVISSADEPQTVHREACVLVSREPGHMSELRVIFGLIERNEKSRAIIPGVVAARSSARSVGKY